MFALPEVRPGGLEPVRTTTWKGTAMFRDSDRTADRAALVVLTTRIAAAYSAAHVLPVSAGPKVLNTIYAGWSGKMLEGM
jgi:hypothetical protein